FLTNGNVNTNHILILLVEDGIYSNGRLSCLPVTDNQLTLTAADRNECIDRLDSGLQRLINRFTVHNTWCWGFNRPCFRCFNRPLSIYWLTEWIDNTSQEFLTDGDFHNSSRTAYFIAFFNISKRTEDNNTDVGLFKVLRHSHNA